MSNDLARQVRLLALFVDLMVVMWLQLVLVFACGVFVGMVINYKGRIL